MATEILESEVYKEMESIENPSLKYPDCKSHISVTLLMYFPQNKHFLFFLPKIPQLQVSLAYLCKWQSSGKEKQVMIVEQGRVTGKTWTLLNVS